MTNPGPLRSGQADGRQQFCNRCTARTLANDGLVYVCDRMNNRIQVFKKDGTYVKETQMAKRTLGDGVTFDIAFSRDRAAAAHVCRGRREPSQSGSCSASR